MIPLNYMHCQSAIVVWVGLQMDPLWNWDRMLPFCQRCYHSRMQIRQLMSKARPVLLLAPIFLICFPLGLCQAIKVSWSLLFFFFISGSLDASRLCLAAGITRLISRAGNRSESPGSIRFRFIRSRSNSIHDSIRFDIDLFTDIMQTNAVP